MTARLHSTRFAVDDGNNFYLYIFHSVLFSDKFLLVLPSIQVLILCFNEKLRLSFSFPFPFLYRFYFGSFCEWNFLACRSRLHSRLMWECWIHSREKCLRRTSFECLNFFRLKYSFWIFPSMEQTNSTVAHFYFPFSFNRVTTDDLQSNHTEIRYHNVFFPFSLQRKRLALCVDSKQQSTSSKRRFVWIAENSWSGVGEKKLFMEVLPHRNQVISWKEIDFLVIGVSWADFLIFHTRIVVECMRKFNFVVLKDVKDIWEILEKNFFEWSFKD